MARLMSEGVRFTSGYSPAPICTPTRRSILCGTTAARSGTEFENPLWTPAEHLTLPVALKQADAAYRCAHFGKWGSHMISTPEECGYDASDGATGNATGGMPESLGMAGGHADGPPHVIDNDDPKRTNSVSASAVAFMRDAVAKKRPFFVQVSYYAPHLSVVCTERTLRRYAAKGPPDRRYSHAWAAMLDELDDGVGRLLDAIDELGVGDETFVILTSDNGGRPEMPGGDSTRLPTNHPLRGGKHQLYEGGIRVPFVVRGPGVDPASVCDVPVAGYDILPTCHELAGGRADELSEEVDGVSLVPLLAAPDAALQRPHGALVFHRPHGLVSALRRGPHKLMVFWNPDGTPKRRELYDLALDPREDPARDLAAARPQLVDQLHQLLVTHLNEVDALATLVPGGFKLR